MATYILIFTIWTSHSGIATSTAEFNSAATCTIASQKILDKYDPKGISSLSIWSLCVKK